MASDPLWILHCRSSQGRQEVAYSTRPSTCRACTRYYLCCTFEERKDWQEVGTFEHSWIQYIQQLHQGNSTASYHLCKCLRTSTRCHHHPPSQLNCRRSGWQKRPRKDSTLKTDLWRWLTNIYRQLLPSLQFNHSHKWTVRWAHCIFGLHRGMGCKQALLLYWVPARHQAHTLRNIFWHLQFCLRSHKFMVDRYNPKCWRPTSCPCFSTPYNFTYPRLLPGTLDTSHRLGRIDLPERC